MDDIMDKLADIGRRLSAADNEYTGIRSEAHLAAIDAHQQGIPESRIAKTLGLDRSIIRKWLGK